MSRKYNYEYVSWLLCCFQGSNRSYKNLDTEVISNEATQRQQPEQLQQQPTQSGFVMSYLDEYEDEDDEFEDEILETDDTELNPQITSTSTSSSTSSTSAITKTQTKSYKRLSSSTLSSSSSSSLSSVRPRSASFRPTLSKLKQLQITSSIENAAKKIKFINYLRTQVKAKSSILSNTSSGSGSSSSSSSSSSNSNSNSPTTEMKTVISSSSLSSNNLQNYTQIFTLVDFPDELLILIMSYLDAGSLFRISTVSKRLYLLTHDYDAILWRRICCQKGWVFISTIWPNPSGNPVKHTWKQTFMKRRFEMMQASGQNKVQPISASIDFTNEASLHEAYVISHGGVLHGKFVFTEYHIIRLVANQLKIEYGDYNKELEEKYSDPNILAAFLPPFGDEIENLHERVLKIYKSLTGITKLQALINYNLLCWSVQPNSCKLFKAKEPNYAEHKLINRFIGVYPEFLANIDAKTMSIITKWPYQLIARWYYGSERFSITTANHENEEFLFQTKEGKSISELASMFIQIQSNFIQDQKDAEMFLK